MRSVRAHKEAKWCVILEAIALMSSFIPTPPFHHSQCTTNATLLQYHTILYHHPSTLLPIYCSQTNKTEFYLTYSLVLYKAGDTILEQRHCFSLFMSNSCLGPCHVISRYWQGILHQRLHGQRWGQTLNKLKKHVFVVRFKTSN